MTKLRLLIVAAVAFVSLGSIALAQQAEEVLRPGDQINLKISGVPAKDIQEVSGLYNRIRGW